MNITLSVKYEDVSITTARWVHSEDRKKLEEFKQHLSHNLALDLGNNLTYLAPTMINLNLTKERWPEIDFHPTREHLVMD
jgi:peptide chain release factor 3